MQVRILPGSPKLPEKYVPEKPEVRAKETNNARKLVWQRFGNYAVLKVNY
ncbi:hypothetical protein [Thalassococcus sp. S3]|nr:hypothetical protein [Thalassococcus sp. S3]